MNAMTITITTSETTKYALVNYMEIIRYYQQPFYKKWFPNAQNDDMVDVLMYAVSDMLQESDFDFTFM